MVKDALGRAKKVSADVSGAIASFDPDEEAKGRLLTRSTLGKGAMAPLLLLCK